MKKQKILFVINTLGRAGAESALLSLLSVLDPSQYDISLYVIMAQGEMRAELPIYVKLCNPQFEDESVLTKAGRKKMTHTVFRIFFRNGHLISKSRYLFSTAFSMCRSKKISADKLLWRVMSDGSYRFGQTFDLAVAYLEGASTYYVADHVKAKKKAAFVHIDYESSGYTPAMDRDCYKKMDAIFTVSDEVRTHFLNCYPVYSDKTMVFHNIIDLKKIQKLASKGTGFEDQYDGLRILTVGRLTYQKAYDIAVEAMKLVKNAGCRARWYVLGEGDEHRMLERKIEHLGLTDDFLLLGAKENPYPYYANADLYVHATRFEGKSIAIQEAQTLGCPVIASDCNGNREQIENKKDGFLCELTPQAIADSILFLAKNPEIRKAYAAAAMKKESQQKKELEQLLKLLK
ncbi:MAG: glycosyltransferase [Lachnospiraceae bacterium]|nr:glycosyltransferase [Lachnospiraceae bacterium]